MLNKSILVMGPTGVGKSSFIRSAIPEGLSTDIQVGHHLHSETSQVQTIHWTTRDGVGINLVDTPGFDDSREGVTDADILAMIATFLTTQYQEGKSQLTGFIYLHRISDTRVGGTSKRNLRIFQKLCGQESLTNVVILTTMWDKVTQEEGLRREQELISSYDLFKPLVEGGAVIERYDGTQESARNIVWNLLRKKGTVAQIVRELVIGNKSLVDTEAGAELQSEVRNVLQRHQEDLQRLEDEIQEAMQQRDRGMEEEVVGEKRKVEEDIAKLNVELGKLGNASGMGIRGQKPPTSQKKRNPLNGSADKISGIQRFKPIPTSSQNIPDKTQMRSSSLPAEENIPRSNAHRKASNHYSPPVIPQIFHSKPASSSPFQESNLTSPTITQDGGNRPRTDAQYISDILKLLSTQSKTTDNAVMKSIICRTNDFATAVVCGIERARSGLSEARLILSSGNASDLHQFADELHQDLTKIHGSLVRARQRMDVSFGCLSSWNSLVC